MPIGRADKNRLKRKQFRARPNSHQNLTFTQTLKTASMAAMDADYSTDSELTTPKLLVPPLTCLLARGMVTGETSPVHLSATSRI